MKTKAEMWELAKETVAGIALAAVVVAMTWLYLVAPPDQMSAECERLYAEMEAGE